MKEMKDEQVIKWFSEHFDQIIPEELISEESKQKLFSGEWPIPEEVDDLGIFVHITTNKNFNRIIGDPRNWPIILARPDLYEKWILPYAVLLFGKTWFDRVKNKKNISRGIPFPLFPAGSYIKDGSLEKARIAQIAEKTSIVLRTYIEGKWFKYGNYRSPGAYIISSLKNEFIRQIAHDYGYKTSTRAVCPYCLASKPQYKITLSDFGNRVYGCPRCQFIAEDLRTEIYNLSLQDKPIPETLTDSLHTRERFERFIGITCVCPNDQCNGKFVPISCTDLKENGKIKYDIDFRMTKNVNFFRRPPDSMLDIVLTCPYCKTKFSPRTALKSKSGFKDKSGFITGLPHTLNWVCKDNLVLDVIEESEHGTHDSLKNRIATEPILSEENIAQKQRLNIIIGEIIIRMSEVSTKTTSGLLSWYFLLAVLVWINKHNTDAHNFFFNWKNKDTRGRESATHQAIFYQWINLIEENIKEFRKKDLNIKSIKDFSWLCRKPKFSGGPKTIFTSVVNNGYISNKTNIHDRKKNIEAPRLVKIISIKRDKQNFINDIESLEWQRIKLKSNTSLKNGDKIVVTALVMSSHPTHAPIQRILRLRSIMLKDTIERILLEEQTGDIEYDYWQNWKIKEREARKTIGIDIKL